MVVVGLAEARRGEEGLKHFRTSASRSEEYVFCEGLAPAVFDLYVWFHLSFFCCV